MKIKLLSISVLVLCNVFLVNFLNAQTPAQRALISDSYDQELLAQMGLNYSVTYEQEVTKAKSYALAKNLPLIIKTENGGVSVLQKVLPDGTLLYRTTSNKGSGATVRTDRLHPGATGTLDLELEGEGIVIGIWDGGLVLPTHELLENRTTQIDGAVESSSHATHVSGTMIGSGSPRNGNAKGMAPKATLTASDFNNDLGEMTPEAASGLLLSNHSYGFTPSNNFLAFIGSYNDGAAALDNLLYNTPYYTPVYAAGNSRNDGINESDFGYDLLTDAGVSKNNIVVAAVNEVTNYAGPKSVIMSNFSSWGPTDDGRIKPDISAKGVDMFSSTANSNTSYSNFSGTSMAAPSVTGSLALLQELHSNMFGNFMKSATLRGLIINTALEAGTSPGPDFKFGWGLLDSEASAKALLDEGFESIIDENTLVDSQVFTQTVKANGVDPLFVTIAWTDLPGTVQGNVLDDPTPRLVNDLDIVLEDANGTLFYPWKFNSSIFGASAVKGVNDVDNVEKVEISAPSGAYTIRVSHKGTLVNGAQDFSIIATGVSESEFNYTVDNIKKKRCSDQDVEFKFNYESSPNFNGPTTLSVSGLPEGITATLTPSVITEDEDFVLLITDLSSLDSGSYPITVSGVSATSSKIIDLELEVVNSDPLAPTVLDFPSNGATDVFIFPTLEWDSDANASLYTIQISESSDFSTFIFEATSIESQIDVPGLKSNSEYFWRVKASTDCTEEDFVGASFTTEDTPCFDLLAAADTPISIDVVPNEIQSILTIPESENVLIGDINIGIDLSHTWLADLTISVVSPAGTEIILMQGACGEANDINVVFDDSGSTFVCGDADPAVSGVLKPANSLSSLIEETSAGDWTLKVVDGFNEDGGVLNNFSLEFCSTAGAFLSLNETTFNRFDIFPNPAKAYFEFSVENQKGNFELNMYDVNGRVLMAKVFSSQQVKRVNTQNLTTGIYFVEIKNGIQRSIKKLIIQ